ncbi:hypothetical protein N7450_009318 [Penicillium hetheringtonii]|uniref:Telomere length regulation/capping, TEN1 n=1 Tax=Penicillium hetheringtonii TaxID=911720 RepID=A0AAD6DES5_9EURO|nr:hypothetical protein N7450_009318 [Penicillium hetheringtonii]
MDRARLKRVFLYELPCLPADTKVRFLGCVRQYNVTEGHLVLEHNYLRGKEEANAVSVDINAVLEDVTSEELRVGAWLNVLGYVRDAQSPSLSFSSSQLDSQSQQPNEMTSAMVSTTVPPRPVHIDAVLVFPAGAIALGEYERILRNVQDVERRLQFAG